MFYRLHSINIRLLRYLILPVLALILTHLVSYRKLPFESDYHFPWTIFAFVFMICAICCETNFICYHSFKKRFALKLNDKSSMARQLVISSLLTAVVFGLLVYSINYFIFGVVTPLTRFLSSLFIAELIILLETLYFFTRDLFHSQKEQEKPISRVWQISSGRKTQMIDESQISYLYSQAGLVYLIADDGRKLLTQFSSFNEVKEAHSLDSFFQINRQYLVKFHAIKTVKKEVNQKLSIGLSPAVPEIPETSMISRYRSLDFKKWLSE